MMKMSKGGLPIRWKEMRLQQKLILMFLFVAAVTMAVNLFIYAVINDMSRSVENVYETNVELNDLADGLDSLHSYMKEYVETKSSDAMDNYYQSEQNYRDLVDGMNIGITDDEVLISRRNIYGLSQTYLDLTEEIIQAKRGRNVEKYGELYEEADQLYQELHTFLYSVNNEQFKRNSESYQTQITAMHLIILLSIAVLILVMIGNVGIILLTTKDMTKPFRKLTTAANEVANGNFDLEEIPVNNMDEIGSVTLAFNQMVGCIREYIEQLQQTMDREVQMQTYLKDAQLKYLQAQINPHFLFNTLNAGMQLAMMEDAPRTGQLLDNLAAFFRYNVRKDDIDASLEEEIHLVDNYVYILNVRFSGEIHFSKDIDDSVLQTRVPSMILQPLVENAVNYGLRGLEDREGLLELSVYRKGKEICISVWDNGFGMEKARIQEVLSGQVKPDDSRKNSNGVGIKNVMDRLKLYFKDRASLDIISEGRGKGTEVLITIPEDAGELEEAKLPEQEQAETADRINDKELWEK